MLWTILSALLTGKEIISEKMEKKAPPEQRFDYDKYWEDATNKVDCMEVVKRCQNGYYYTTTPKKTPEKPREVIPNVSADKYNKYIYEKTNYGETWAEDCRKLGFYK